MNDPVIGTTYRHYKGRLYRIVNLALFEHSHEPLVIYECLYVGDVTQVWARPRAEFFEHVQTPEYTGPRFTPELGT